jgi:hypothetical protein
VWPGDAQYPQGARRAPALDKLPSTEGHAHGAADARAKGPGTYPIPYGSSDTYVSVKGSDLHSSLYSPPNEPSPAFAIIKPIVVKKLTYYRVSVGFDPLWNASLGASMR